MQQADELNSWYESNDPWGYKGNPEDARRIEILLSEIPPRHYRRTLDIGCGEGFVTQHLPGDAITGVDISQTAIAHAAADPATKPNTEYRTASLFELPTVVTSPFDLIVITGVLYAQYIGRSLPLVYRTVDRLLEQGGILVCVHIEDWYRARFPYPLLKEHLYAYREYTHRLEVYVK